MAANVLQRDPSEFLANVRKVGLPRLQDFPHQGYACSGDRVLFNSFGMSLLRAALTALGLRQEDELLASLTSRDRYQGLRELVGIASGWSLLASQCPRSAEPFRRVDLRIAEAWMAGAEGDPNHPKLIPMGVIVTGMVSIDAAVQMLDAMEAPAQEADSGTDSIPLSAFARETADTDGFHDERPRRFA